MDEEKVFELLEEIHAWVKRNSDPNDAHHYHRCIVCNTTWWDDGLFSVESHSPGCWVPQLKKEMTREPTDGR